jgi:hypothetical protein
MPNLATPMGRALLSNLQGASSPFQVEDRAVVGWGNSETAPVSGYLSRLDARPGWITYNGGIAGQDSPTIVARMKADTIHRRWTVVLWMGTNGYYVTPDNVLPAIADAINYIGHSRFLVLPIIPDRNLSPTGTTNRDIINAKNAALKSLYGSRFVDLIPIICTDPGDVMPTSISADGQHFNDPGYDLIEPYIYAALMALPATVPQDVAPDPFAFTPATSLEPSNTATSNTVTITGIGGSTPISVSTGQYSINGGAYTSSAGNILNGDTLTWKVPASATPGATITPSLTIGSVTVSWSLTTTTSPNLVLDPGFDDPSKWGTTADTAVTGSQFVFTNSNYGSIVQIAPVAFVAGGVYRVTYTINSITGQIRAQFNGGSTAGGTLYSAPGTYQQDLTAGSGNNQIRLQANGGNVSATGDNYSVRRLS